METDQTERTRLAVQARFRGVIIDERMLRPRSGERYRIGVTARAAAPAPDRLGLDFLALVESTFAGYRLRVTPGMDGTVTSNGRTHMLRTWIERQGTSFLLPPGARAHLSCGDMEYDIDWSAAPPPVRAGLLQLRWSEQRYTAGTGAFLLLAMLLASLVPPDARALSLHRLGRDVRLIPFRLIPPEEPTRTRPGAGEPGPASAALGAGPSGRAGRPTEPARAAVAPRRPDGSQGLTDLSRAADVRSSGVLALLYAPDHPALSALFDRRAAIGVDPDVLTGILAVRGDGDVVGGLELRGTGARGGGPGERTMGLGRLRTIGPHGPGGPGDGRDGAASRLVSRRAHAPDIAITPPTVRGALDKEIIRRVVRRHLNQVRYCYEQELARAPTLTGRLAVRFTIAASGEVASSAIDSSTFDSPRVALCVVQAVRRWRFPQPQGGGIVVATYPFTFTPAGQSR
jgi:TonB family protein